MAVAKSSSIRPSVVDSRTGTRNPVLEALLAMREPYAAFAADRTRSESLRVMATGILLDLDAAIAHLGAAAFVADRRRA